MTFLILQNTESFFSFFFFFTPLDHISFIFVFYDFELPLSFDLLKLFGEVN